MADANYIKVDDNGDECVAVYDAHETEHFALWYSDYGSKGRARVAATELAQELAQKLGCEWGTNW